MPPRDFIAGLVRAARLNGDCRAALPLNGGRTVELEMAEAAAADGGDRDWHSLRTNPDYRADWREHGTAASFVESSGFPLRTQSEADLEAARWGLLAWEDPRTRSRVSLFWVDDKMVRALAVKPEESAPAVAVLAREPGVSFTGLRLRDGSLVLKAKRGRLVEQLRIIDGDSFDFERTGLEVGHPFGLSPPTAMSRIANVAVMIDPRMRTHSGAARGSGG